MTVLNVPHSLDGGPRFKNNYFTGWAGPRSIRPLEGWCVSIDRKQHVERFRGGLVFKAHRLLYHSFLGSGVIKKKKKGRAKRR